MSTDKDSEFQALKSVFVHIKHQQLQEFFYGH